MLSLQNYPFVHVILLPTFFILFLFSYNQDELLIKDLFIPIVSSMIIVSVSMIIIRLFSKNSHKNFLIFSMLIILFFIYGHVFITIDNFQIGDFDIGRHLFLLPLFFGIFILCLYLIKNYFNSKITLFLNVISVTLIFLSLSNIVTFNTISDSKLFENIELTLDSKNKPNIYYIILDEYAGKESLEHYYDFDNSKFLDFLKTKEFFVMSDSFSNYPYTGLSTASTLNMKYLDFLTTFSENHSSKPALQLFQKNNVMTIFNDNDYTTIYIYGGVRERVQIADINICERYMTHDFPNLLFRTTVLTIIHKQLLSNDWAEIRLCALNELSTAHEKYPEPIFVFAHLRLPHDPFTFGPNGEILDDAEINLELTPSGTISNYLDQLVFTNKKISDLIEILLNLENPPIIILQSDHGARFDIDWEDVESSDASLHRAYNNFHAVYFPNKNYDSFSSTSTNVNTFRIVFNEIFDKNLEILDDKIFLSHPSKEYEFTDITDKILNYKLNE